MLILSYFLIQENHSLLQKFQHRYGNVNTKLQQLNYTIYTKLTATSPTTATTTNHNNSTKLNFPNYTKLQLNVSTMATLGTGESGHYKEAAIVEKFKPELMYGLFASRDKKNWPLWRDGHQWRLHCTLNYSNYNYNWTPNTSHVVNLILFL